MNHRGDVNPRRDARRLALAGMLAAVGTLSAHLIWFPAGVARAFPVQHAINVVAGVLLGPWPATAVALVVGVLRNALGLGTPLAFPGGMIGALLAGLAYRRFRTYWAAIAGEVFGTGILGALASVPVAHLVMGQAVAVLAFVPGFLVSTVSGSILAWVVLKVLDRRQGTTQRRTGA
ncbi:MAG TPA: energy coupling factor transporter S component ThiW [Bacillota bacterium]